jgi:hypothetical protein
MPNLAKLPALLYVLFAGFNLVQGLSTGKMKTFRFGTLDGEFPRKGNPVWFWATALGYTLGLVIAVIILADGRH